MILFIKTFALSFLSIENTCCSTSLILIINNSCKNRIEFETKIALLRLRWYNIKKYDNVYIVSCGLSDENFKFCEEICRKSDVELMKIEEFSQMLLKTGCAYEQ